MDGSTKAWPADSVERRAVADLVPYARNSRTHSPEQIDQIAASIREWGFTNPILIDETGTIIAGHGRVMAAQKLGIADLPCMTAAGWTDAQKQAYVIADNQLALNASWDDEMLRVELRELDALDFDLSLVGFDEGEIADFMVGSTTGLELSENYSRAIEAPIYEPKGLKPEIHNLFTTEKADELKAEILEADLPGDVSNFLLAAADRHTVFDFANIAEFYAHADQQTQSLMERSALVIIDFDRAIEEGFIKLSEGAMRQVGEIKAGANAR